jgi:hypothetical protein
MAAAVQTQDVTKDASLPASTVGNQGTIADRVRSIMAPTAPGEAAANSSSSSRMPTR